jgi:hypothetical protein
MKSEESTAWYMTSHPSRQGRLSGSSQAGALEVLKSD